MWIRATALRNAVGFVVERESALTMLNTRWLELEPGRKFALPLGLLLGYPILMSKSIPDIPKKGAGRPFTGGRRDGVLVRLEVDQFEALDKWILKQKEPMTRPEAIRRLVELGLKAKR